MKFTRIIAAAAVAIGLSTASSKAADIVDTAASAGQFNTLLAAAQAAGLAGALKGNGPLTVFAPTDAAFAKLPEGTVESLLKPENKDKLVAILTYHVLPRKLTANMIPGGRTTCTDTELVGPHAESREVGRGVTVDGARVVAADVTASNGVIHVIDSVLLPKPRKAASKARKHHRSARKTHSVAPAAAPCTARLPLQQVRRSPGPPLGRLQVLQCREVLVLSPLNPSSGIAPADPAGAFFCSPLKSKTPGQARGLIQGLMLCRRYVQPPGVCAATFWA